MPSPVSFVYASYLLQSLEKDIWVLNFNFLGLDLSNAPSAAFGHIMALDFSNMSVILLLLIPVLAVIASVISMKVTQAQTGQNQNTEGQAAQMTKSMNLMMPVKIGRASCRERV